MSLASVAILAQDRRAFSPSPIRAGKRILSCKLGRMAADVPAFDSVQDLCKWSGFGDELTKDWAALFGFPDDLTAVHPRVLASFPKGKYEEAIEAWCKGDGSAHTMYTKGVALMMYNTAVPVGAPPGGTSAASAPAAIASSASTEPKGRRIKMHHLIDPADETEVAAATSDQVTEWYENYKAVKFGEPLLDKEPTPDQLAALHQRIIVLDMDPYADFSLLTPYGKRMAKVLRHRSWVLQEDGTYKPLEVPGPDSFVTWDACFKVYEVILLMLRYPDDGKKSPKERVVVTPIALETYHDAFATLCRENPECWHLCQKAEDRCRAEHFPRLARRLREELGRQATWSEVFTAAAVDDRYWE